MHSKIVERRARSEVTRKRILQSALDLFNEYGTSEISTNKIAAEVGISPGNLYYHFRNKKEIIRILLNQYAAENEPLWNPSLGPETGILELRERLVAGTRLSWKYRFFDREILALLRSDSKLSAIYKENYERRLGQQHAFAEELIRAGYLSISGPSSTIDNVNVAIWLIFLSWITFLEVTGDPRSLDQVEHGADIVFSILNPYLTEKGKRLVGETLSNTEQHETIQRKPSASGKNRGLN